MSKIKMPASRTINYLYKKLGPSLPQLIIERMCHVNETYRTAIARLAKSFRSLDRDTNW